MSEKDKSDVLDDVLGDVSEDSKITSEITTKRKYKPGVGIDIGTSNIVVTRQTEDGTFVNKFHRNMLYPLPVSEEATDLLEKSEYLYIKVDNFYYIVGEDALNLVNALGKGEIVRPMKEGILNPSLKEATDLLFYIIKAVVRKPIVENEPLRYSIPANPIDSNTNNLFHKMILENFFKKLGFSPKPVNEAMCIAYDCNPVMKTEDGNIDLTGISCSCGAGMWNIALSFKGLSLVEFSCTKSGDYLDEQTSIMTGIPISKVIKVKERKLNLEQVDMSNRVEAALSIYYDEMIDRMIHHISQQFKDKSSEMDGEVEIVIAGGTSMANGFCKRLENVVKDADFPFKVYRIRHSQTPFYSVSQGACIRALADAAKK